MQEGTLLDFGACYQLDFNSDHIKYSNAPLGSRGSFVGSEAFGRAGSVFAILKLPNQACGKNVTIEMNN